jgi:hypothetical protein
MGLFPKKIFCSLNKPMGLFPSKDGICGFVQNMQKDVNMKSDLTFL